MTTTLTERPAYRALADDELASVYGATDDDVVRAAVIAEMARRDRVAKFARERAAERDAIRGEWHDMAFADYLAAESACRGVLVAKDSRVTDGWQLWSGTERYAMKHASEELRGWWLDHPRITVTEYARQAAAAKRVGRDDLDAETTTEHDTDTETEITDDAMDLDGRGSVRQGSEDHADSDDAEHAERAGSGTVSRPVRNAGHVRRSAGGHANVAGNGYVVAMGATQPDRPTAAELIAAVRERGPQALARMRWLDEQVDLAGAAAFLGMREGTARTIANRASTVTGRKGFPEPDKRFGRSPVWTLRAIVIWRAGAPGRGAAGTSKPGSGKRRAMSA